MNKIDQIVQKAMDRAVIFLPPSARTAIREELTERLRQYVTPIDENLEKIGVGSAVTITFRSHGRWDQWVVAVEAGDRRYVAEGSDLANALNTAFDKAMKEPEEEFWFYDGNSPSWAKSNSKETAISMNHHGGIEWAIVKGTAENRTEKLTKLAEAMKEAL